MSSNVTSLDELLTTEDYTALQPTESTIFKLIYIGNTYTVLHP